MPNGRLCELNVVRQVFNVWCAPCRVCFLGHLQAVWPGCVPWAACDCTALPLLWSRVEPELLCVLHGAMLLLPPAMRIYEYVAGREYLPCSTRRSAE